MLLNLVQPRYLPRARKILKPSKSTRLVNSLKIKDLKPGTRGVDVTGKVVEKSNPEIRGDKMYASATLEDETGRIALNLWRNQVDQTNVGDTIKVPNAFTRVWAGVTQVSTWADIVVLEKAR